MPDFQRDVGDAVDRKDSGLRKALVLHSGGMDSSICLALAIQTYGKENVTALAYFYHQRHANELDAAKKICSDWGIKQTILKIDLLKEITQDSLTNSAIQINNEMVPNTLVIGRNGLMARLGAIYAYNQGVNILYMGVIQEENSNYRDCSRHYMDLKEEILRIDLADPFFKIYTPLVNLKKSQTLEIAKDLGILDYLLKETITCYEGVRGEGCKNCPACRLRNKGLLEFHGKIN